MYTVKQKLLCFLTAILLSVLLCVPAMATSTDYDSAHPENLNIADLQATAAILNWNCRSGGILPSPASLVNCTLL